MSEAGDAASIAIEIAIAWPERQRLISLQVPAGTTVGAALALAAAELGADRPGAEAAVGIFGVVVARGRILEHGERIEVYRALPADPKETRRRLAREGRTMGRPRPG